MTPRWRLGSRIQVSMYGNISLWFAIKLLVNSTLNVLLVLQGDLSEGKEFQLDFRI